MHPNTEPTLQLHNMHPQASPAPEQIYPTPGSIHPQMDSAEPAIIGGGSLPPVTSGPSSNSDLSPTSDQPVPVVRVLSTRGVEYGMMTIALWVAATTLAWVILNMINGSSGFDTVVVPTASLVVCVPVFGFFFLRLKKAELTTPQLRLDPSKRRWSQTTQFLAYFALLINLIYFVYTILQHASGGKGPSIGKAFANLIIVLMIAGGILFYYWRDEHRIRER